MPELPEVETIRRGITPHVIGKTIKEVKIYQHRLRWPISTKLPNILTNHIILTTNRRGKYLLLNTDHGCLIIHFGMSGILRIVPSDYPPDKHDHIDFLLNTKHCLRFHDPRRFGSIHWTRQNLKRHRLLKNLGSEPFTKDIGLHLFLCSKNSHVPIKNLIMNHHIITGIGNIYANEILFKAGIDPRRKARKISKKRYLKLETCITSTLQTAIQQGGTTLKDFTGVFGSPGYFALTLQIYGQDNKPCSQCGTIIKRYRIGNRATFYCAHCQN